MGTAHQTFPIVTQLLRRDLVRFAVEADKESRVRRFIASSDAVDSYNTTLDPNGWELDRFKRNPVVPLMHRSYNFPIGVAKNVWVENKKLMVDIEFGPADDPKTGDDSEQALRWVDRGVMGVSVGFDPLEWVYNEERETGDIWQDLFFPPLDYTRMSLFEVSVVTLPANPDAVPEGRQFRGVPPTPMLERVRKHLAPAAKPPELDLKAIVDEVIKDEVRAFRARNIGKISGG